MVFERDQSLKQGKIFSLNYTKIIIGKSTLLLVQHTIWKKIDVEPRNEFKGETTIATYLLTLTSLLKSINSVRGRKIPIFGPTLSVLFHYHNEIPFLRKHWSHFLNWNYSTSKPYFIILEQCKTVRILTNILRTIFALKVFRFFFFLALIKLNDFFFLRSYNTLNKFLTNSSRLRRKWIQKKEGFKNIIKFSVVMDTILFIKEAVFKLFF